MSWAVVDVLVRRAGQVTVSNPTKTKAIASAKVKTDKVDARVPAELGASKPGARRPNLQLFGVRATDAFGKRGRSGV